MPYISLLFKFKYIFTNIYSMCEKYNNFFNYFYKFRKIITKECLHHAIFQHNIKIAEKILIIPGYILTTFRQCGSYL